VNGLRFDGAALKRDRNSRGLTLRQLGAASGVDASSISRLERGDRHEPLAVTLIRLSTALDTDLRRWFTTEDTS
jgi:transcriptional regulator with XRE-family HTH domain